MSGTEHMSELKQSIFVGTPDGKYVKIVEKGASYPTTRQFHVTNTEANQDSIEIHLLIGESELPETLRSYGRLVVGPLNQPSEPSSQRILIELEMGKDRWCVKAHDTRTGQILRVVTLEHC